MFLTIDWPSIWQCLIVSIISSFVSSLFFLFFLLRFLRPSFKISKFICYNEERFYFKLVNLSIYNAFDANIELFLMEPFHHTGGNSNVKISPIPLLTNNVTIVNRNRKKINQYDQYALFALLVSTKEPIQEKIAKAGSYIELRLTVRHGLTGLADTFTQQYANGDVIKDGHKFCFANDLNTMPINKSI